MKSIILKILEIILPGIVNKFYFLSKQKSSRKIADLNNHDVFNTLNRVRSDVANMKFYTHGKYDKVKSKMCFDFAKHKTLICGSRMKDILNKVDIDDMNKDKLKLLVLNEQRLMHEDYIRLIIKEWESRGIKTKDIDYKNCQIN